VIHRHRAWRMPPNLVWLPAKKYHPAAIPFFA